MLFIVSIYLPFGFAFVFTFVRSQIRGLTSLKLVLQMRVFTYIYTYMHARMSTLVSQPHLLLTCNFVASAIYLRFNYRSALLQLLASDALM